MNQRALQSDRPSIADSLVLEVRAEAEAYCARAGIKLNTLTYKAIGATNWFRDRERGRPYQAATLDRIRKFMADNPPLPATKTPEQAGAPSDAGPSAPDAPSLTSPPQPDTDARDPARIAS